MSRAGVEWTWAALRASRVLLEDDDVLVLDKPPGISVMGERHDADVVELAAGAGERLFPVHRIDKVTSGAVLLAKHIAVHGPLTRQFADRTAIKGYLAVVRGAGVPRRWTIDLPLGVGRKNRVRIAAPREALAYDDAAAVWSVAASDVLAGRSYPSTTRVHRVHAAGDRALVLAVPATGRRHQIRVHLAWTGTPVLGDPLFRSSEVGDPPVRAHLHSWKLAVGTPWRSGPGIAVTADPDAGFLEPVTGDPAADGGRPGGPAAGRGTAAPAGASATPSELLAAAEDLWHHCRQPHVRGRG